MGQVFPLCSARKGWDVACMYCILQIFVMLGCPTQTSVKLSFLPTGLNKAGGPEGGQCCSHAGLRGPPLSKGQNRGGEPHAGLFSYLIKTQM